MAFSSTTHSVHIRAGSQEPCAFLGLHSPTAPSWANVFPPPPSSHTEGFKLPSHSWEPEQPMHTVSRPVESGSLCCGGISDVRQTGPSSITGSCPVCFSVTAGLSHMAAGGVLCVRRAVLLRQGAGERQTVSVKGQIVFSTLKVLWPLSQLLKYAIIA